MTHPNVPELITSELTQIGFTDPKRDTVDDTAEQMFQQVEEDESLAERMTKQLSLYATPVNVCTDNWDEWLQNWVYDRAAKLHGIDVNHPYM